MNEMTKPDMKGIVGPKGKNLAGTPRSAGIDPKSKPGKNTFSKIRHITGASKHR